MIIYEFYKTMNDENYSSFLCFLLFEKFSYYRDLY